MYFLEDFGEQVIDEGDDLAPVHVIVPVIEEFLLALSSHSHNLLEVFKDDRKHFIRLPFDEGLSKGPDSLGLRGDILKGLMPLHEFIFQFGYLLKRDSLLLLLISSTAHEEDGNASLVGLLDVLLK